MIPASEPPKRTGSLISVDVLDVKKFLNHREALLKLEGQYTYEDLKTPEPVKCAWEIRQEVVGLSVKAHLTGLVEQECARCLEPFEVSVDAKIDERYVLNRYIDTSERERELQAEDFYESVDEEGTLDLKDLAHQFLIIETAQQPTCGRAECSFTGG